MPYFIKSPKLLDRFPHNCPYCGISPATTQFKQTFSKLKMAKIPVHAESVSIVSSLPGCASCSEWFRKTRMMMIFLGVVAILGFFWVPAAVIFLNPDATLTGVLWFIIIAIWAFLLLLLKYKGSNFKIAYFSDEEVIYSGKRERYMYELATLNDLKYEEKPFLIKWS